VELAKWPAGVHVNLHSGWFWHVFVFGFVLQVDSFTAERYSSKIMAWLLGGAATSDPACVSVAPALQYV
jgi:hypothetical protein